MTYCSHGGEKMVEIEKEKSSTIFEEFKSGDRVKRTLHGSRGKSDIYDGIVMAVKKDHMIVCWDRINGRYNINEDAMSITSCPEHEIFEGNEEFSPIRKSSRRPKAWV